MISFFLAHPWLVTCAWLAHLAHFGQCTSHRYDAARYWDVFCFVDALGNPVATML